MALIFLEQREKNLPDSLADNTYQSFGSGSGDRRFNVPGNWETDPHVYDFYLEDVEFYFFTRNDLLDYIHSLHEEINYPTQKYNKFPNGSIKDFYDLKLKEISEMPEVTTLHFVASSRSGGTSYIANDNEIDGEIYNRFREICLSSSKQGPKNAYTTYRFVKYKDTTTGKCYINLIPIFSKLYSMEELANILKRDFDITSDWHTFIYVFGMQYAEHILSQRISCKKLVELAEIENEQVAVELQQAVNLFQHLKENKISINPIDDKLNILGAYLQSASSDDLIENVPLLNNGQFRPQQVIYYGAPGTGKSFKVENREGETEKDRIRTTFHPDTDYSSFVGCYKPVPREDDRNKITYKFVPQCFTLAYVNAWKRMVNPPMNGTSNYSLIIEEINRGNCAQIFGDIFQLLDRDEYGFSQYAITPDIDLTNYLADEFESIAERLKEYGYEKIATGTEMKLPPNLNIIATMNTSDQSLFPIDSAFKRRWDWEYIPIDYTPTNKDGQVIANKIDIDGAIYDWGEFIEKVNGRIYKLTHSEDKQLGYFFVRPDNGSYITMQRFVSKVIFYLWSDIYKDYAGRADSIFKINGEDKSFNMFFKDGQIDSYLVAQFIQQFVQSETTSDSDLKVVINGQSSKVVLNGTWGGRSVAEVLALLSIEQLETLYNSDYNQTPILGGRCKLIDKQPMPETDPIEPAVKSYADYRSMQWQIGDTGYYVQAYNTQKRKEYIEQFAQILGNDIFKIVD